MDEFLGYFCLWQQTDIAIPRASVDDQKDSLASSNIWKDRVKEKERERIHKT